jgi:hypothetical protein
LPLFVIAQVFERDVDFAAAPDVFPPDRFNAGIMLLKPDKVALLLNVLCYTTIIDAGCSDAFSSMVSAA